MAWINLSPRCFHIISICTAILIIFNSFAVCGGAVGCYECFSVNDTHCPEIMTDEEPNVVPYRPCKNVHQGNYCIKDTGMIGGSLETRRYCSAEDLGNSCKSVRLPGDPHEYESCVYSCFVDGCNLGWKLEPTILVGGLMFFFLHLAA